MSTILSTKVIEDSKAAVDAYVSNAQEEYAALQRLLNELFSTGFIGDAADGYNEFFMQKVTPAVTTNLIEDPASLMQSLKSMMEEIGEQFLRVFDPNLKQANIDAGNG